MPDTGTYTKKSVRQDLEKVHPGGLEPPTFGSVGRLAAEVCRLNRFTKRLVVFELRMNMEGEFWSPDGPQITGIRIESNHFSDTSRTVDAEGPNVMSKTSMPRIIVTGMVAAAVLVDKTVVD